MLKQTICPEELMLIWRI